MLFQDLLFYIIFGALEAGISVAPASQVREYAVLLLQIVGNYKKDDVGVSSSGMMFMLYLVKTGQLLQK
jgi:hypothetical protein